MLLFNLLLAVCQLLVAADAVTVTRSCADAEVVVGARVSPNGCGRVEKNAADAYWGFFGHRRINRLATFTLDAEMMPFFRHHIDYLAEHAVDPDKRRYATAYEAVRHYIDLDHWGQPPFADVPRNWVDALLWRGTIHLTADTGDTTHWRIDTIFHAAPDRPYTYAGQVILTDGERSTDLALGAYRQFWYNSVLPTFYSDTITVSADSVTLLGIPLDATTEITVSESFSEYGILPYHLLDYHRRLTRAFAGGDAGAILRLSAEIGHYVGDAHVPLHTTENYNGQLTGQTGIHAFWESRLPELFADEEYDLFVGPAAYIDDPRAYYWDVVLKSHSLVDSVLNTERRLRAQFPGDQQFCFDERLDREVRTQCPEFARAWSAAMNGMVEERFRAAILSVGSVWYSCWVDAGQPDLGRLLGGEAPGTVIDTLARPTAGRKGRAHE